MPCNNADGVLAVNTPRFEKSLFHSVCILHSAVAVVLFLGFSLSACGLFACGGLRSHAIAQAQNRKLNEPLLRRWMRRSDIMAHLI